MLSGLVIGGANDCVSCSIPGLDKGPPLGRGAELFCVEWSGFGIFNGSGDEIGGRSFGFFCSLDTGGFSGLGVMSGVF